MRFQQTIGCISGDLQIKEGSRWRIRNHIITNHVTSVQDTTPWCLSLTLTKKSWCLNLTIRLITMVNVCHILWLLESILLIGYRILLFSTVLQFIWIVLTHVYKHLLTNVYYSNSLLIVSRRLLWLLLLIICWHCTVDFQLTIVDKHLEDVDSMYR